MEKRREQLLNIIIKEHIKTGLPVGSEVIVSKYRLGVSSATVRNEMVALEEEGLIIQPHTSAGRVPTEQAYHLYLSKLKEKKLSVADMDAFRTILEHLDESAFKQVAKAMSQATGTAVFWAFHRHNLFYTGITNLLSQPEFSQPGLLYDISAIIDRLDETINQIYDRINFGPQVFLGADNPFSPFCATVMSKYRLKDNVGLYGVLGPVRMDYEKNLAIVRFIDQKLNLA